VLSGHPEQNSRGSSDTLRNANAGGIVTFKLYNSKSIGSTNKFPPFFIKKHLL